MPPGGVISKAGLTAEDEYTELMIGPFDKIDITPASGDVVYQVYTPSRDWQPFDGVYCRAGVFKSVPGYSDIFPPGPTALRFKRATEGIPATVDVDIYAAAR